MNLKTDLDLKKFESFDYRNYLYKFDIDVFELKRRYLNNLSPDSIVLNAADEAIAILNRREWDENILGVKTYALDDVFLKKGIDKDYEAMECLIKKVIDYVNNNNIKLLIFRFSFEKLKYLQLFEKYGFITVDILSTFLFNSAAIFLKKDDLNGVRPVRKTDYSEILEISRDSFESSRIYQDRNIPKHIADKFYFELTKSILNEKDNLKLVIEEQGRIIGFAIGNKVESVNRVFERKLGYLELISILRSYRGKKFARKLFKDFLIKFQEDLDYIEISTQITNKAAINLYASFGLHPMTYIITMHYWNRK